MRPEVAVTLGARLAGGRFHGDIKPGNVLLADDGAPVLADFGLSVVRQTGASLGASMTVQAFSPPYAAPERLLDNRYAAASEVWGLGAVLFELLTGAPPFVLNRGESLIAFAKRVAEDPLEAGRLEHVPEPLRAIVVRALAKPRDERPTIGALAQELRTVQKSLGWADEAPPEPDLSATTISAATMLRPAAGPPADTGQPRPRRWGLVLAGAAAVLLILVGGSWAALRFTGRPAENQAAAGPPAATPSSSPAPSLSPASDA